MIKGRSVQFIRKEKLANVDKLVIRVVFTYLAVGIVWIFFSDHLLLTLVSNQQQYATYSSYKGWAFIVISASLLIFVLRKTFKQQLKIEQALQESEERWKFALDGTGEGVWDWNLETNQVYRSGRWHSIYGYAENEVGSALDARKLIHPDDIAQAVSDTNAYLEGKSNTYSSEFRLLGKDGTWKWTLSRGMIVSVSADGKPLRMIGTHIDISERKHSEAQVFRLAHYDSTTDLPNRVLFHDRIEQDIKKANRSGQKVTLMFLDLDRFKEVNDTLGHHIGDLLLKQVSQRLLNCVRIVDTVARFGGDEFTIILNNLNDVSSIERVAQDILNKLAEPFQLGNENVYITTSIGITVYPEDAVDVDALLKNADQAMYTAKEQGRNRYYYFTASMQKIAQERMHMTNDLRVALTNAQFVVYYQPIVELATGLIHKAEALIRWNHPVRGLVSPAEFIPIAEDTGLITEIGNYVFGQAAQQVLKWRKHQPNFQISVNKSPVQFKNEKHFHQNWLDQLTSLGLPGDSMVIEITEGLLLDTASPISKQLESFRETGIQVAIDDFGTGYSSLSYLKKFEIDYVKIDQSFVHNIKHGANEMVLCEAIIVMAHKLGIKVIAEGVETTEQRDLLLSAGCDYAQGYLFSRPVMADDFEKYLFKSQDSIK